MATQTENHIIWERTEHPTDAHNTRNPRLMEFRQSSCRLAMNALEGQEHASSIAGHVIVSSAAHFSALPRPFLLTSNNKAKAYLRSLPSWPEHRCGLRKNTSTHKWGPPPACCYVRVRRSRPSFRLTAWSTVWRPSCRSRNAARRLRPPPVRRASRLATWPVGQTQPPGQRLRNVAC